jgi:hypothetical protein
MDNRKTKQQANYRKGNKTGEKPDQNNHGGHRERRGIAVQGLKAITLLHTSFQSPAVLTTLLIPLILLILPQNPKFLP